MVVINRSYALLAAAFAGHKSTSSGWKGGFEGEVNCAVPAAFHLEVPPGLNAPPTTPPSFVALAFGVQNYTCSSDNVYTSAGAVAELIDISCGAGEPWFETIHEDLYNVWQYLGQYPVETFELALHRAPQILGQHYFIPNPTTGQGLSPKWDFTSEGVFAGNKDAFFVGVGTDKEDSPDDPAKDVPWLQVGHVSGKLADQVYRTDTVGGQPPSSCKYGKDHDLQVKYTSKYFGFGGSLKPNHGHGY